MSIQRMCELAGVSRASFYRDWEQKAPGEAETALRDAVQRTALAHRGYGYRRITPLLQRAGFVVGEEKVRGILRNDNLLAVRRRKFVVTTDSNHRFQIHPNLAETLELSGINQLWVADITYIRLRGEFVFLAGGAGRLLAQSDRLGVGANAGNQAGASRPGSGDSQPKTEAWVGASFRSRYPVCEQQLRQAAGELRRPPEHEPTGAALGKR
jgi:AcrR family transcriptional regulator